MSIQRPDWPRFSWFVSGGGSQQPWTLLDCWLAAQAGALYHRPMSSPTPHDALFKTFLTDPDTARDFLSIHLPATLRSLCDLSTLRLESGSFIDKNLRAHYSDILYSVGTIQGYRGYIYTLIEHQSTPDRLMAFRLMRYSLSVMQQHVSQGHEQLPLVIPLLFYHGSVSPYPYSLNWLALFAEPERAAQLYSQPFSLVDVTVMPDETILQHRRIALLELLQKHIRRRDLMELAEQLVFLLRLGHCTHEQLQHLISYMLQVGDTTDPLHLLQTLAQGSPQHEEAVMTIAQKLEQRGELRGREQGRQEGRLEVAATMLRQGIAPSVVMQLTGLTEQDLQQLKHLAH